MSDGRDDNIDRSASAEIEAEIRRQVLAERASVRPVVTSVSTPSTSNLPASIVPASKPVASDGLISRWKGKGGVYGVLATILAWLVKLQGLLFATKFLVVLKALAVGGGSMLISMLIYAKLYGARFGVAMVLLIFLHELGHVIAVRIKGRPVGAMMFVPLMGAMVTYSGVTDAAEHAFIALAGPLAGALAGIAAAVAFAVTGDPFWTTVAGWSFLLNLLNLLPFPPLDGSKVLPLLLSRSVVGTRQFPTKSADMSSKDARITSSAVWGYRCAFATVLAVLVGGVITTHAQLPIIQPGASR